MKKEQTINIVERALQMASGHLSGRRDETLPAYIDSQVERFAETLREMKASLENADSDWVSDHYMGRAIADGWPFDSELGKVICEAEDAYHSLNTGV